jgi:hypothetical protein
MAETRALAEILSGPVKVADPQLVLQITATNPLGVGGHTFQLVVTDQQGNDSQPQTVRVIVLDDQAPTAVPRALDANGGPLPIDRRTNIPSVSFGTGFMLDATNSRDIGTGIDSYTWQYMGP